MPHAIALSGTQIVDYDPSKAQPLPEGWTYVTPEQFALAKTMAYPNYVGGEVVNIEPPPPTPAEIAAQRSAIMAEKQATLDTTYRDYILGYFPLSTLSLVAYGAGLDRPKCLAVQAWQSEVYALFQQKIGYLTYVFTDFDFSAAGPPPYTAQDIHEEVYPT